MRTRNSISSIIAKYRFTIALSMLMIGVVLAMVFSSYVQNQTVLELISFSSQDRPGGYDFYTNLRNPILGQHYFGDFYQTYELTQLGTPYLPSLGKWPSQYPPVAHLLMSPLTLLSPTWAFIPYILCSLVFLIIGLRALFQKFPTVGHQNWIVLLLFTAPFLSTLDRGNNISLPFMLVCLAINDDDQRSKSAYLIGAAAAIKIYPLVFALFLLKKTRKFSDFIKISITALGLNIFALSLFEGGFQRNLQGFIDGIFLNTPQITSNRTNKGSSLWALNEELHQVVQSGGLLFLIRLVLAVIVASSVVAVIRRIQRQTLSSSEILSLIPVVLSLVIPQVPLYQLIFLSITIAILLSKLSSPSLVNEVSLLLLILVLIPKNYVTWGSADLIIFFNSLALLAVAMLITFSFPSRFVNYET